MSVLNEIMTEKLSYHPEDLAWQLEAEESKEVFRRFRRQILLGGRHRLGDFRGSSKL